MSSDEEMAMLDRHCQQLGEHFDTVQIFVTRYDSEVGTVNINYGAGNWFARYGQVQDLADEKERGNAGWRAEGQ